ncbi:MAG: nuclear transport factor 2 family protein [Actinobacteria bacterium]|nr:nuclear transport factor 2 family protein [Actinomycetota bacterium]
MSITLDEARTLYERRRVAWLAEDLEGYLACFAEDVVLETPTRTVRGHAEYESMTKMSFEWAKPVSFDFHHLAIGDDDVVMCDWTITVARRADNQEITWCGMNVCQLKEGVIQWWREYYQDPESLKQAARA